MTDTAVIVVSYNTRELTLQAVAAARKAAVGLDARVVVADNGSTDGTAAAVRAADPEVVAFTSTTTSGSAARTAADPEVVVLVDADNPGYGAGVHPAAPPLPSRHACA